MPFVHMTTKAAFPMLTAQNEFQIPNLHHKKKISNIKLPVFLMLKVKKIPLKFLEL